MRRLVVLISALAAFSIFAVVATVGAEPPAPEVNEIFEPSPGGAPLNPADVHMEAEYYDADGDNHYCTDWQIWDLEAGELVWDVDCTTLFQERLHVHLGDGEFINSYAGREMLKFSTDYELKLRFWSGEGEPEEAGEWAERPFSTEAEGGEGVEADLPWAVRPGYKIEEVAGDFQLPVNIAMVPDPGPHPGDPLFYVAELYGSIKVVSRDGTVRDYATGLLNFNPNGDFPGAGEMGLAGLVVEPESGDLFASLVYEGEDGKHYPKVIRLHSDEHGWAAEGETTVLDMDKDPQGASHQVSNLTISPDGYLFLHNGEGGARETSQDLEMFRGKILRMTLDGEPVGPGIDFSNPNPFFDTGDGITAKDYIWAYGFRNPFGGAWRLSDGTHWLVENGPEIADRLSKVVEGENYRWPEDETMSHLASYRWLPPHAPVNIEFVEPGRFEGSGFPPGSMGHAFVTESGPTYAVGPQERGKRISEFGLDTDGNLKQGPETLAEYTGVGHATAVGLAAGLDGLYFSDLYPDPRDASPIDRGAHVYRISYCGDQCPQGEAPAPATTPLEPVPPPAIAGFHSRRKAFAVARGSKQGNQGAKASSAVRRGTYFAYAMQTSARATISIRRAIRIKAVDGSCHKPGKAWRIVHRGKGHCVLWSRPGFLRAPGAAGWHRRPFKGHLGRRWLRPGRYVAAIKARDPLGRFSQTQTDKFRIVRDADG